MSKSNALKKTVEAAALEPTQFELGEGHKLAVEYVLAQESVLQQQQQQFMQKQLEVAKRKTALVAEIEKLFNIPDGSILSGVWTIMDGVLIKQKR
jgi:hypothetical protein